MKKFISVLVVMLLFQVALSTPQANALVVVDPGANKTLALLYAKMTAVWTKLSAIYTVAKGHLDSAVEVENMVSEAYSTYQTIVNLDLQEIAEDFKSGDILNGAGPFGKLAAIQMEIEDKVSTGDGYIDYIVAQKNRIQNLRRLAKLKFASFKNMGKASKDLKERDSAQVTAQSTATLAALATMEENRLGKAAIAVAKAKRDEKKSMRHMAKIYTAMGR